MISRLHLEIDSLMVKEDQEDNEINDLFIVVCKPIFGPLNSDVLNNTNMVNELSSVVESVELRDVSLQLQTDRQAGHGK